MTERLPIVWETRVQPLVPCGCVAVGGAARELARRVLRFPDDRLSSLTGVASQGDEPVLALRGPADALPWVDGAAYLGVDPEAPGLLLPTTRRPAVPLDLFDAAVRRRNVGVPNPVAVLESPALFVPMGDAMPIDRELLGAWIES